MGLERGVPDSFLLRHACREVAQHPTVLRAEYDEAAGAVLFDAFSRAGELRSYRLTLERGRPVVEEVRGPAGPAAG